MAWRDQSRGRRNGFRGDCYRPSDRSRSRSQSRRRSYYDENVRIGDPNVRPNGPSRNNSTMFGLDSGPPPARGSVTPSIESPHSPIDTVRVDGRLPPAEPSAVASDPRLSKKGSTPFKMSGIDKEKAIPTDTMRALKDTNQIEEVTTKTEKSNGLLPYLELLVQLASLRNDVNSLNKQVDEQQRQKQSFLNQHPEAKEVQAQIDSLIDKIQVKLTSMNELKKQKETEIDAAITVMSPGLESLLNGILSEPTLRGPSKPDRSHLDYTAISKRMELLETKDRLREMEKQDLEKKTVAKIQANEEKWLSRIEGLEEQDRKRDDEMIAFKADLLAKFNDMQQDPLKIHSNKTENEIAELKIMQNEHKHNFANLVDRFVFVNEFKDLQKDFVEFKGKFDPEALTSMKMISESTTQRTKELENDSKASKIEISTLIENVSKLNTDLAEFKQLEGKYTDFWNTTQKRLDSLERTAAAQETPQQLKVIEDKIQSFTTSHDTKQKVVEGQISSLKATTEGLVARRTFEGLQSEIERLSESFDQRFEAFVAKVQQDVQATVVSQPTQNPASTSAEEQRKLDDLASEFSKVKTGIEQVTFDIKGLNSRYNQISGSALYKDILRWVSPSIQRIPALEELNESIMTRMSNIERNATSIRSDLDAIKKEIPQPRQQPALNNEILGKIHIIETRMAELSPSQYDQALEGKLSDLQSRVQKIEELEADLPALYYTKENGDDLDKRFQVLESLEIKDGLQDLRQKHAAVIKLYEVQQEEHEQNKDDIESLREAQERYEEFVKNLKSICDARQQEIDAGAGEVEAYNARLSGAETGVAKLTEQVERMDEETKTDIRSMKQEISTAIPLELAFLRLDQLASTVRTADEIRARFEDFAIYQVWFGGGKVKDSDRTTYHAVVVVNKADAVRIKTLYNNTMWKGRTMKITLMDDNARLEDIYQRFRTPTPGIEFQREGTVVSSARTSLVSRALPTSPLAKTFPREDRVTSDVRHTSEKSIAASNSPAANLAGTVTTPFVITDSQDPAELGQSEVNGDRVDDIDDIIELNTPSDTDDLSAWTGRPPLIVGNSPAPNSKAKKPRISSATPILNRKRANQEGESGTGKKARQI